VDEAEIRGLLTIEQLRSLLVTADREGLVVNHGSTDELARSNGTKRHALDLDTSTGVGIRIQGTLGLDSICSVLHGRLSRPVRSLVQNILTTNLLLPHVARERKKSMTRARQ
jgi:hypothetical protein